MVLFTPTPPHSEAHCTSPVRYGFLSEASNWSHAEPDLMLRSPRSGNILNPYGNALWRSITLLCTCNPALCTTLSLSLTLYNDL